MTAQEIRINRDTDHDILYVIKDSAADKPTTNIPINADIVMRVDRNREIVGFIIDDFSMVCPAWKELTPYELMEEFDRIIKVLNEKTARELTQAASPQAASQAATG